MESCKTCKFWSMVPAGHDEDEWGERSLVHSIASPVDPITYEHEKTEEAIAARYGFVMRFCACPEIVFYHRPPTSRGATLCDGSEYAADLLTGQDFGCVLHQPADLGK